MNLELIRTEDVAQKMSHLYLKAPIANFVLAPPCRDLQAKGLSGRKEKRREKKLPVLKMNNMEKANAVSPAVRCSLAIRGVLLLQGRLKLIQSWGLFVAGGPEHLRIDLLQNLFLARRNRGVRS